VAGYLIAVVAFALPFFFGVTGAGRSRMVLGVGAALALVWFASLVAGQPENGAGQAIVPLWLLAGLAGLLYLIWCGGLWLGLRLRRARAQ
jgi:type VI protein secretion system component VasK